LTDIINAAVDGGDLISGVPIEGRWREIDTVQDLERAEEIVTW
jgi:NDP-sugar pyrophosphorylase family protein